MREAEVCTKLACYCAVIWRRNSELSSSAGSGLYCQGRTTIMDGRGFDELTKKLAKGASRRSLLKALLGGAGAVAATAVVKNGAEATHCDEGAVQVQCPAGLAGEAPEGSQGGLAGVCCTGIGTCCSRECIDFGASHEGSCAPHSSEVTTTTAAPTTTTTAAPTTTTAAPTTTTT